MGKGHRKTGVNKKSVKHTNATAGCGPTLLFLPWYIGVAVVKAATGRRQGV